MTGGGVEMAPVGTSDGAVVTSDPGISVTPISIMEV